MKISSMPGDWQRRFDNFKKRAREFEKVRPKIEEIEKKPLPSLPYFNLILCHGSRRAVVGFRLTILEAERIERIVRKRLEKLRQPDDAGSPYFEMTQTKIERA